MKIFKTCIFIAIVLSFVIALCGMVFDRSIIDDLYAKSAVVIAVNHATDKVIIEDSNGFLWSFSGCEDWQINDHCACIMDNNATETIFDDKIVSIKYETNY